MSLRITTEGNMPTKRQREEGGLDRRLTLKLALAGASALLASKGSSVLAADGKKTGQTTVARLLENERVGVLRMVSVPGDKGAMRERPDRLLYIIQGAKVRFHYPGGKTEEAVWKTGDVVYQKADNRQVENIDTRDLEYISVHLK
jgi:hypothetical protein